MANKDETHKIVTAEYDGPDIMYCVPKDWDLEDIEVRWGIFYYKGVEQELPQRVIEPDGKRPKWIHIEDYDVSDYFDCEDADEDADE
jgi:hypothetical protein